MLQLALSRHLRHFTAFTVLILGCAQAQSQEISACFPSVAVPKSDRKFLTGPRGPYPIGVWVCDWPAAYVTSEVVHILLEEILGFHVVQTGPGPNTVDAFYALAGCANPLNIQDRGCSATPVATTNHINVEGWTESYARTWAQIERDYPQNAPRNLGNMGYFGKTSMFLPKGIQLAAYNQEGLILEFYRGFNVSWTEADKYFDPPSSINKDWLKPCVETRLMITKAMEEYVTITDDWEGVEIVTNENGKSVSRGKCWDDYFWYAPACRDKPSKCVIFFTGGSGWNLEETMQKATAWNMPLAPAVAKTWGNFTQLPLQIDSTFYWWVPDPTFLSLDAVEITFPPFDRTAFRRGDMRTAPTALSIDKYVSQDLQTLAPEAHQLVRDMVMDLETVNDMLRDQKKTGDSSRAVACRWLQGHEDVWKPWLPDPTKCFSGFGLYHPPSNSFVKDRRNPVSLACSPCPSGTFSSKLVDGAGITFVCEPCPAGSIQASGASVECIPCKAGEYQDENGSILCKRCGMGEYQDQTGATGCKPCPTATSTHGLGSLFLGDCGCKQGSINVANATVGVVTCVACPEGLRCPLGSSLESLKMGDKNFGEAFTPRILEGYFSTEEQPLEVFKCQTLEHCPGGVPGRCPGRREGIPCSECPSGTSWTGKECRQCSGGLVVVPILAGGVFFLGLIAAYYAIPPRITAKATQGETLSMCAGVATGLVQCLAIIGLTSVRWPKAFESIAKSSSVVLLDMEIFSIACMVGGTNWGRYIMSLAVFPLGPLWLLVCFTSSRCFKNCMCPAPWTWTRLLNTMGHFLQVGFSAMSALSLQPLMCYQHPNGQHSLLKHAGVFCNTGEHLVMLLSGIGLLSFMVVTFVGVCAWGAWHIPRWSLTHSDRIWAFAFLISRFRMDRWWYGVPVLLRFPLLSLCPVLATDFPPAQAAMVVTVLMAGLLLHICFLPWKVPVVNLVDGCLQAMLLLLVAITPDIEFTHAIEDFHQGIALVILSCMLFLFTSLTFLVALVKLYQVVERATGRAVASTQDFTILNLRRRQSSVEIAELIKKVSERLLDLEAASAKEVLDQMHPGDVSRIIDTIQLLRTELLSQRSDDVRTTSNRSSTSRVSSCKRRSVLVPYNAPSPSDEDPKNTAKGEGVPRSAGVFACAMRLLRRPQRVQPAGLGGGAEMMWLNVPGVAGSRECACSACGETLEQVAKVEAVEKEEKEENAEKEEKEDNAEKVEKEEKGEKEEVVDDPTCGEPVTNAVLMDSRRDAPTASNRRTPTLE